VTGARLVLTRAQILAFRRHVGALDERLPPGRRSLRQAAWAGLQDSMPRAAVISIHARVERTQPSTWEDPSLVQVWGPRYHAYVVPARDLAVFSLGRLPENSRSRRVAEDLASRLDAALAGGRLTYGEAGALLGEEPNRLRYAAATGTVVLRWDGARQPVVWSVPAPAVDPREARLELARRYLHVFGPTTSSAFARWAGTSRREGVAAFDALRGSLTAVRTPIGDAWILARDEAPFRAAPGVVAPARLLPSGDAYFLLHGADRELLVREAGHRATLWTSRVWPGAVLVAGEIIGTWRRAEATVTVQPWRRPSRAARDAVENEARTLPIPGIQGSMVVRWEDRPVSPARLRTSPAPTAERRRDLASRSTPRSP
jgi:Winged helix DNA-binding domain